jgi:hypothetical protein
MTPTSKLGEWYSPCETTLICHARPPSLVAPFSTNYIASMIGLPQLVVPSKQIRDEHDEERDTNRGSTSRSIAI